MGKITNDFCRICDNHREINDSSVCGVSSRKDQLAYVLRRWCGKGKINGVEVKFITPNYIEIKGFRYARRGSEEDDIALIRALTIGGETLESFEMPFDALKLSSGRTYKRF